MNPGINIVLIASVLIVSYYAIRTVRRIGLRKFTVALYQLIRSLIGVLASIVGALLIFKGDDDEVPDDTVGSDSDSIFTEELNKLNAAVDPESYLNHPNPKVSEAANAYMDLNE